MGPTTARGYGNAHQRLRRAWAPAVAAGVVACARCGGEIFAWEPWDLGHDDHDRARWTGPEHRRCNRATAGRRKLTDTQRAILWKQQYEADQARLERERHEAARRPAPAIY